MAYGIVVTEAMHALRKWLASSNFKEGERLPSERILTGRLGIKHNAVNRAMNQLIFEGLVRREGYKLFYVGKEKPGVASLACDLVLARSSRLLTGFRRIAKGLGITLRVHYYGSIVDAVTQLHALDAPGTEAVLFDPPHLPAASAWEPALGRLLQHGIPSIALNQFCEDAPCVAANYARAVEVAFSHLRELGHEEIGLVTVTPRSPIGLEIYATWQALDRRQGGLDQRITFYNDPREGVREIARRFSGAWRAVTALIVYADFEPVAPHLIEELARNNRHVPKDLSLISLGDFPHLATAQPPISAVAFDIPLMLETMLRLAQRLARKKQTSGLLRPIARLRVEPHLIPRKSTVLHRVAGKKPRRPMDADLAGDHGVEDPGAPEFTRMLRRLLKRSYSLTAVAEESRFHSINLASLVNRPLNFRRGWLGDLPLPRLGAGKHVIHGVPFRVLGGKSRTDRGVVVFRSTTNETGGARVLPSHLKIPIGLHARSIYVLHGCGYARFLAPFASYAFYAGTKCLGSVPLVTLGNPPLGGDAALLDQDSPANIQDWWPDFPHSDFSSARRAPIMEMDAHQVLQSHAYLYTLEWRNPVPDLRISHMEITADTRQSTTLGVVAISLLKRAGD